MASMSLFTPPTSGMDDANGPASLPDTLPYIYTPEYTNADVEAGGGSGQAPTANVAVEVYTSGPREHLDWKDLDLSSMLPQDYPPRVLMMPIAEGVNIHPYGREGCFNNWVEVGVVEAPKGSKPAKLLAIAPNREQVGCCVTYQQISCVLLFDPSYDRLVLRNDSLYNIYVTRLYEGDRTVVGSNASVDVHPGEWDIRDVFEGVLVEFKVLGHTPCHITPSLPTKRSFESSVVSPKKTRLSVDSSANRLVALQETSSSNPLLTVDRGEVVSVGTGKDSYSLKRMAPISDQQHSSSWHAQHSDMPGKAVVVKIVKCGSRYKNATVRSVETWMREVSIHSSLGSHNAIVPYLGSDARFLSIYTEYVDAKDLLFHVGPDNKFNGTDVRAWRILGDIASALSFLHENDIVHGDIKLANILFDPLRGAVLMGFDLSFKDGHPVQNSGAPWYLPPEFAVDPGTRGFASDMWALGIVMMWVLHALPMPEKQESWVIGDIHPEGPKREAHEEAQSNMEDWLNTVRASRLRLKAQGGELVEIVETLVQEEAHNRTDADTLVQRLKKCHLRKP
ncbi:kinase-like domain-containing protein [Xylaria sp. FL1777]|nr:kinase-like domain-containing protein [Xylaria sp. FL1777]